MLGKLKKYWRVLKFLYGKGVTDMEAAHKLINEQSKGEYLLYGQNTVYNSTFGANSYVGHNSIVFNCDIGRYCSIGPNVVIGYGDHPTDKFTTSPKVYYNEQLFDKATVANLQTKLNPRVTIGHDVWIGANVFIKNGVTIGTGAIVGAGSIVLKDIPEYAIAIGAPARIIRERFDKETIEKIKATTWWENSLEELIAEKNSDTLRYLKQLGE